MKNELKSFGNRVRQLRTQQGMTLQELADKCGYTSRASINKIEKGLVDVSQTKIVLLASALGVSVQVLLGLAEMPEPYFLDRGTAEIAKRISQSKELKALFNAAQNADPEDLQAVYAMLLALNRKGGK